MKDDELLNNALCALQDAYDYLEAISFDDSEFSQCKDKVQECYDTLNRRFEDDE